MRRTKQKPATGSSKTGRRAPLMMALEPRVMFDGAVAPTAHAIHHDIVPTGIAPAAHGVTEAHGVTTDGPGLRASRSASDAPTVVFVDSRVEDPNTLLKGIATGTEVVFLKPQSDGLLQIGAYLEQHHEVGSVEIIAHGGTGNLLLGSTDVTAENIGSFSTSLRTIGSNLRAGSDILVYACNTASNARGVAFVDSLATETGHVVAASSNVTGLGGDWNLEIATGRVTAVNVLARASEAQYGHTLGTTAVSSAAQLNAALLADDLLSVVSNDTITLTSDITYAAASDEAVLAHLGPGTLTIDGGGHTINANYLSQVLKVVSGNVILENITLEHGLVSGAGAALSAAGTSALGAGIYNAGTLTLLNVNVIQNLATGGGGGGTGVVGAGGGGGSGAFGNGGAPGGGIGAAAGNGSAGGKGSGVGGGLGGTAGGGGAGGAPTAGGANGSAGGTAANTLTTVGGGGGGTGYVLGNGGAGGSAAGGIYNAGTGKLYVLGSTTISNNLAAGGGGGGGIGTALGIPFHGGIGGQAVGGIFNSPTGQVYITSGAYAAMTGDAAGDGATGTATGGASNSGFAPLAAANRINSTSGTVVTNFAPPLVSSIALVGSSPTNTSSDQYVVTFNEAVTGVNASDFVLTNTGSVAGVITSVTGSGATYTVNVNPVAGDGTMRLDVYGGVLGITDTTAAHNPFTAGYTSGPAYTVDHTPPVASSITLVGVSPNNATTEQFTVQFSENVTNVDVANFNLVNTGTASGTLASVTPVSGSTYIVTVNNVSGNGTMQLNLNATGTGIVDTAGNAILGGALLGPAYTIVHTLPVVTSINTVGSSTNNAGSDAFTVTFSESVSGVNVADFSLANTGTAGGVITSVTGSGSTYAVLVNPAFGDGTMKLNFAPVLPVVDAAGNFVGSSFTNGQVYTIQHTPPIATSITAAPGDSSSATSEQFVVTLSENVAGVDAGDFTLATTGTVGGTIRIGDPDQPRCQWSCQFLHGDRQQCDGNRHVGGQSQCHGYRHQRRRGKCDSRRRRRRAVWHRAHIAGGDLDRVGGRES